MTGPARRARRPGLPRWLGTVRGRRQARASERVRRPQPLLKQRMPSGRGAMEQPNITSGGAGVLTPRFWVMVVLTGIAAGLLGALMMAILFNVQYAAFGYHAGSLQHGAAQASGGAAGRLLADRGSVRRCRVVPAAAVHPGRAVGDRRGGVERRRAAVVPPLPGHLGDLRGRHRHGRLDRPGGRAQAAGRRVRERRWPAGAACRRSSGGCWWRAAAAPGSPRSTTSRWPAPCSPRRSSSAASPCRSCCRPSRARRSRPPPHGYTCPITPSTPGSRTTGSPGR